MPELKGVTILDSDNPQYHARADLFPTKAYIVIDTLCGDDVVCTCDNEDDAIMIAKALSRKIG